MSFPVLVVVGSIPQSPAVTRELQLFVSALEEAGIEVSRTVAPLASAQQLSRSSAIVIVAADGPEADLAPSVVSELRHRSAEIPIFLFAESRTLKDVPNEIFKALHGFIHMYEDTPEFVAKQVARAAKAYVGGIAPPFFKALLDYAENGSYSWHCPGHSGGVAFLKSPAGQMFHQFFGENMLRADVCNAVEELGQLLDHTGPAVAAEQNAARIFGADHLFFVTNGTSTSNKIVWHSCVGPDDIVIVDRNCHKSNLHAIMMTGATPVFLPPTRNHHGIIGPIPAREFSMESIQKRIDAHPLIEDKARKPRILTLTQSTYDGVLYNVDTIQKLLDGKIEKLHFDEAWLPHAAFHPLYEKMHAIESGRARPKESTIFATQSTHKTLAGLSQASQILVREPEAKKLNRHVFNEAYLMHTSTSPQYSIIASCDVAAAMMEGPGGRALVDDSIREATDFRLAMRKVASESDWWFEIWGPDVTRRDAASRETWALSPDDRWHGFGEVEPGFNMLDPTKVTVLTPGLDASGSFEQDGIPASIVTQYLSEHGVVVEKCGLYSFFIMFTIGITKGRWNTLVAALQQFKSAYDRNEPLSKALPRFTAANERYSRLGLRDLCQSIHEMNEGHDVARMTTAMYLAPVVPAMKPAEAHARMAREEIERVEIDDLEGQVTAVLLTPYPPGIPLLVPGERFNREIVRYLEFARAFNERFPGLETNVHGLVTEVVGGIKRHYVDCVKLPTAAILPSSIRRISPERRARKRA